MKGSEDEPLDAEMLKLTIALLARFAFVDQLRAIVEPVLQQFSTGAY